MVIISQNNDILNKILFAIKNMLFLHLKNSFSRNKNNLIFIKIDLQCKTKELSSF